MSARPPAIQTIDIHKRFAKFDAVRGVTFQVAEGSNFALLGANGAGKSTLIRMLTTLVEPSAGRAFVCGHDVRRERDRVRRCIGVVPQNQTSDPELSTYENMDFYAGLYNIPRSRRRKLIYDLLESVDLLQFKDRKSGALSGGMRRRLEVARCLVHQPRVLFLDEPTTGLDPASRQDMWIMIQRVKQQCGLTMLLTTHYMEEADMLCDTVAIIHKGQLVALGTPAELKSQLSGVRSVDVAFSGEPSGWSAVLEKLPGILSVELVNGTYKLQTGDVDITIRGVLDAAQRTKITVLSLAMRGGTLDDVLLYHTGHNRAPERAVLEMAAPASGQGV